MARAVGQATLHQGYVVLELLRRWPEFGFAARRQPETRPLAALVEGPYRIDGFALAKLPIGKAIQSHHNFIAGAHGLATQDAALPEGFGVGPGSMMIRRVHHERAIRNDAVQMVPCHRFIFGQDDVICLVGHDDAVAGIGFGKVLDAVAQIVETVNPEQVQLLEIKRTGKKVHVAFDDPGQNRGAFCIDDTRRCAAHCLRLVIRACENNNVALDRKRFGAADFPRPW